MTIYRLWTWGILIYAMAQQVIFLILFVAAYSQFRELRPFARYARTLTASTKALYVSILVPAHNEAESIVASVRGLLLNHYAHCEVVVINDGSDDATLDNLTRAFQLEPRSVPSSLTAPLTTAPVRAVYRSSVEPRLLVVDKVNGGKADALNAGLNWARYPLFCAMDADSILDPDALPQLVWPFLDDPERVVAAGGTIRIANGGRVSGGRIVDVGMPRSWIARVQIVEYLRAFLLARLGLSRLGMLLIISGAFGMFRRDLVMEVGGYARDSVGEDMELVVRIHRYCRDRGQPYRLVFMPDPVCWTEVPETWAVLGRQRDRWHRGLVDTLIRHRGMALRSRYGRVAWLAWPYYALFEGLAPMIEVLGYCSLPVLAGYGLIRWEFCGLFLIAAVELGVATSTLAVLIEEMTYYQYPRPVDTLRLVAAAIIENFGYRQILLYWKIRAIWGLVRGKNRATTWGTMTRQGFHDTSG